MAGMNILFDSRAAARVIVRGESSLTNLRDCAASLPRGSFTFIDALVHGAPCPPTLARVVTRGKSPHSPTKADGTWKRHRVPNTDILATGNPSSNGWGCQNVIDRSAAAANKSLSRSPNSELLIARLSRRLSSSPRPVHSTVGWFR